MALGGEEGVERRAGMNTTCISLSPWRSRRQGRCPQRAGKSGRGPYTDGINRKPRRRFSWHPMEACGSKKALLHQATTWTLLC